MIDPLQRHLDAVRRRLRAALACEFAGRLLAGAACAFFVGLVLDYLFEPAPPIRQAAAVLLGVGAVAWLGYRCVAPMLRALPDRVVASWIERRRPELQEALTTVVEDTEPQTAEEQTLLDEARARAAELLANHETPGVVLFDRPNRWLAGAGVGVAGVVLFALLQPQVFGFYLQRIALSSEPWPRRVSLSIDDFAQEADGRLVRRVAVGARVELVVRADLTEGHIAPPNVELRRRSPDGEVIDEVFVAVGEPTVGDDAHQEYRLTLERANRESRLSIRGGDGRLEPLWLIGERRPQVVSVEVEINEPAYLGARSWRLPLGAVESAPEGASITLRGRASKPLSKIDATWQPIASDSAEPIEATLDDDRETFTLHCPPLLEDAQITLLLTDQHGIVAADPYPISLPATPDRLPRVALTLRGIGPTITPSARLPCEVVIEDDHNATDATLTITLSEAASIALPLGGTDLGARFRAEPSIDLLTFSSEHGGELPAAGQRLGLVASARDRHDLGDTPRISASQKVDLAIVTPEVLLARLEQREVNLRQAFEATTESVRRARIALDKLRPNSPPGGNAINKQGEATNRNQPDTQRLRVLRVVDELSKAAQETLAAANAFEQVYLELEYNRIQKDDLKDRIKTLIATPLREIGERLLPTARDTARPLADDTSDRTAAIAAAQDALRAMEGVLEKMRSLETYNEVVSMLRQIIDEQQSLNDATKRSRREGLRRLLID